MTIRLLLLILSSVSLSAIAQLCLKLGTAKAAAARGLGAGSEMFAMLTSPFVIGGLALYGLGALLWLYVLGRVPLSFAYPFVGIGFILTMLAGLFILGESVSAYRIAGTVLIALGCVLVAQSGVAH